MSKIVFFCIPAHGHTNPTLGVVRELIARGHEVLYYSYPVTWTITILAHLVCFFYGYNKLKKIEK